MNIEITCHCPFCGKNYQISVDKAKYENGLRSYAKGALIQDAFPDFTPSQREALKTGICDECWDTL